MIPLLDYSLFEMTVCPNLTLLTATLADPPRGSEIAIRQPDGSLFYFQLTRTTVFSLHFVPTNPTLTPPNTRVVIRSLYP